MERRSEDARRDGPPRPAAGLAWRRALTGAASVAAIGAGAASACQLTTPPDQYFDPSGVTQLASYGSSAPPTLLVAAGDSLFYAQGSTLFRVAKDGSSAPEPVPVDAGAPPTDLAFDGVRTVAFCAGGVLSGFDAVTLSPVALPAPAGACQRIAILPDVIAYTFSSEAGAGVVAAPREAGGASETLRLPDEGGVGPSQGAVTFSGSLAYVYWNSVVAVTTAVDGGRPERCVVAAVGAALDAKIVVFDGGVDEAGSALDSLLARGGGDSLKRADVPRVDPRCCNGVRARRDGGSLAACAPPGLVESAPGGQGDFTVQGSFFYWSDRGTISRLPLDSVRPGLSFDASPFVDLPGAPPIPALVVDDQYAYFVAGTRVLRAALPP